MGEVIYTAASLKAFGALIAVILVLGVIGLIGVLNGIFRRKEKIFIRVVRGCAGVFFWLLGAVLIYVAYNSMTTGSETMTVQVHDKQVSTSNCVNGGTCYVLNTESNGRSVDLVVSEEAYQKVQTNSCYLITYYSGKGLFGKSGDGSSFDTIDTITRIETAACQ